MNRWWIYQKERFPLLAHGPLVAAFSASAVSFSALLRGATEAPPLARYVVAFVVSLASFLLLRIADEFKDAEDDARWRPYRPVPRGLVKLRELLIIGIGAGTVQLLAALALSVRPDVMSSEVVSTLQIGDVHITEVVAASPFDLRLIGLLVVTWTYFALMSHEFFARAWLKARPVVYLFSHMGIMPLVDWFATGCDWVPAGGAMPAGLFWFLAASFCNGLVIELGRKIRAPAQEEPGVETYTALWGRPVAVSAWLAAVAATFGCALLAASRIAFTPVVAAVLGTLLVAALALAVAFLRTQTNGKLAKTFEAAAGVWTLTLYLTLGVVPLLVRS